jgi:hypothetical protein
MCCCRFVWTWTCCILLTIGWPAMAAAQWKPHAVRQLNGSAAQIQLPAKMQIVSEPWNRVATVPYIVYMPEKDRLLMLIGCDYPHQAMVLSSDDHGATWTKPAYVHVDDKGKPDTGMGIGLTYLGQGRVVFNANKRWFSTDFGATWGNPLPIEPMPNGKPWNGWDPMLVDRNPSTDAVVRLAETGYDVDWPAYQAAKGANYSFAHLRFSSDEGRTWEQGGSGAAMERR